MLIDIGANLLDPMFQGIYHGSRKHEADLGAVLDRAWSNGVEKIIITAGTLGEARAALRLARTDPRLYCTVGVHPTRCREFEAGEGGGAGGAPPGSPEEYLAALADLAAEGAAEGKVVAVGEFGLDYDRLQFCDKETQLRWFEAQFALCDRVPGLPLFLHSRACPGDFGEVLARNRDRFTYGVVHSFTGTMEEAQELLDLGLYIGINGCSLKTEENCEVVKRIPLDRLMLETDAPWCEIRATHAAYSLIQTKFDSKKNSKFQPGVCVKSRYEPCHMVQVAEAAAALR
ncbi:unnamed protein product, partial [Heterosigma akashiwo]